MRTLKYAILGLIDRTPMTGYDITREFNSNNLANFWYANHSQVYPELTRLTNEGLITCEIVNLSDKFEKKLYTITEKGHLEFLEWLRDDEPLPPTPKDVFRLRMYFSDAMSPEDMMAHLEDALKKHEQKRGRLLSIMEDHYQRKAPETHTPEYGDFIVLEGAILREDSYIQWLKNCIARRCTGKD